MTAIDAPLLPPKVAVIVLSWNGVTLTLECLESLSRLHYERVEIVVVDNHSTDGTVDAIRARYGAEVTIIENDENIGYSRGNNVGIRYALAHEADLILLLNNDTIVDPALVSELADTLQRFPETGIVGPKIYYASPADQIWFAGGEVFLSRGTARHIGIRERDRGQYESIREIDYVSGCALMARREVFELVGLLDPAYAAYFEDTDFCMRAKRRGYRIKFVPSGKVWHKISSSTGGQLSVRKIRTKLKSTIRFFGRYAGAHHWLTIPFFFVFDVTRIIVLVAFGRIRNTRELEHVPENGGDTA